MSNLYERTKAAVEATRKLCEEATPGPWLSSLEGWSTIDDEFVEAYVYHGDMADKDGETLAEIRVAPRSGSGDANAAFIAASRTLLPALVAEAERTLGWHKGCSSCRPQPDDDGGMPLFECPVVSLARAFGSLEEK